MKGRQVSAHSGSSKHYSLACFELVAALAALFFAGCACCAPQSGPARPEPVERKLILLRECFDASEFTGPSGHTYPVFVVRGSKGPPILLLHEMPALNAETLELAKRIGSHGYRVYVPLLFGQLKDNPADRLFAIAHMVKKEDDPFWLAGHADVERPVVRDIAAIARSIVGENRPMHLGVIGLCFTGMLPLALLGQEEPLPELVAPVISQPALPFPSCGEARTHSLGISEPELERARQRIVAQNLEILGFRFEKDQVSPWQRFARLNWELNQVPGSRHFLDQTLMAARYHDVDGLPPRAHSVLTGEYRRWTCGHPEPATHYAYRELIAFLDAKLKHRVPQWFEAPGFAPGRTQPLWDAGDAFGG